MPAGQSSMVRLRRVYDPPSPEDGYRVLVDRLWPRGVSRQRLELGAWHKELAPSDGLRRWFAHDPARWREFVRRYSLELRSDRAAVLLHDLARRAATGPVTLVYAARDERRNNAVVLRGEILRRSREPATTPSRGLAGESGPISAYLAGDHRRLDALLHEAVAGHGAVKRAPYAEFRTGLLRHIGLEEKILLPALFKARGGLPPITAQLRKDHAAFACLLMPSPTPGVVGTIRGLLDLHNPIEEAPGGLYADCDELLLADADAIVERLRAAPAVPVVPHRDGPRVHEHIRALLFAARGRSLSYPA